MGDIFKDLFERLLSVLARHICAGYNISRAILSDAGARTRGIYFFTSDCTPYCITSWHGASRTANKTRIVWKWKWNHAWLSPSKRVHR